MSSVSLPDSVSDSIWIECLAVFGELTKFWVCKDLPTFPEPENQTTQEQHAFTKALYECGISVADIFDLYKNIIKSMRTVYKWINTKDDELPKPRAKPGKRPSLNNEEACQLVIWMAEDPTCLQTYAIDWALETFSKKITQQTVSNYLKKYSELTDQTALETKAVEDVAVVETA